MKKILAWITAAALAAGLLYWQFGDRYPAFARAQLSGEIEYAEFCPHIDWDPIRIRRPSTLDALRPWLCEAARPAFGSHPFASCPFRIGMRDGTVISLMISPTGRLKRSIWPDDPGAAYSVVLQWGDYHRQSGPLPFKEELEAALEANRLDRIRERAVTPDKVDAEWLAAANLVVEGTYWDTGPLCGTTPSYSGPSDYLGFSVAQVLKGKMVRQTFGFDFYPGDPAMIGAGREPIEWTSDGHYILFLALSDSDLDALNVRGDHPYFCLSRESLVAAVEARPGR